MGISFTKLRHISHCHYTVEEANFPLENILSYKQILHLKKNLISHLFFIQINNVPKILKKLLMEN